MEFSPTSGPDVTKPAAAPGTDFGVVGVRPLLRVIACWALTEEGHQTECLAGHTSHVTVEAAVDGDIKRDLAHGKLCRAIDLPVRDRCS